MSIEESLNLVFHWNNEDFRGLSSFFPDIAPRPKNTSFSTLKIEKELNFTPLGLREGLKLMKTYKH